MNVFLIFSTNSIGMVFVIINRGSDFEDDNNDDSRSVRNDDNKK